MKGLLRKINLRKIYLRKINLRKINFRSSNLGKRDQKKGIGLCLVALVMVCLLGVAIAGCGKNKNGSKVIFTKGLEKDEVFRIGDEVCKSSEMMVFLTTTQHEYESVYGEKIWNTSLNGVTLEDNVKDNVLEKVAQIKSMYLLAKQKGIELEETEKSFASAAAKDYFGHLTAGQKESLGITEEQVQELYEEYALAHKVYRKVIEDVNPEISDDEARIVTVQQILIPTAERDANGKVTEFLTAQKQEQYELACDILEMAKEGKKSFEELASKYSQDPTITYSFGKGEMEPSVEAAAFRLETNEISAVVESSAGYHILKCVNTFDEEETKANKLRLLENKKNEVFGEEYDDFVNTLVRKLNTSAWEGISLCEAGNVPTVDFFEIYDKFFLNSYQN